MGWAKLLFALWRISISSSIFGCETGNGISPEFLSIAVSEGNSGEFHYYPKIKP